VEVQKAVAKSRSEPLLSVANVAALQSRGTDWRNESASETVESELLTKFKGKEIEETQTCQRDQ
jgi:hypothetical protein